MMANKEHQPDELKPGPAPVIGPPGEGNPAASAEENSLAEQVKKLEAEKQDLTNTLVRRQADFENYRKRVEKERHQERHRGVELLIENLLPVLDAFERALAAHNEAEYAEYRKGFELIYRQLRDALTKQGLERIESVGKEFNPHFHHAIERVETTAHADGVVIGELQPGYVFHGRVLRPAMVRVASAAAPAAKREN
ncbi:MAG TPA: nucleotide exchange factor GrpE [Candidatus Sulfotelmatobacter sp.]|nr:nucleotide exchange factor GrpE [Candidatus Sulfotelmatobacter sp.]